MNIVTPFPSININTANVHTESARRDNQLREVIPPPAATKPSNAENKTLNDGDKTKQPGSEAGTYDAKGRLAEDKVIEERQQGSEQGDLSNQSKNSKKLNKSSKKSKRLLSKSNKTLSKLKS